MAALFRFAASLRCSDPLPRRFAGWLRCFASPLRFTAALRSFGSHPIGLVGMLLHWVQLVSQKGWTADSFTMIYVQMTCDMREC